MANFFSNMLNYMGDWFASKLAGYLQDPMGQRYTILTNYYSGDHRPQLKIRDGAPDDNIFQNIIGLTVDRSVSRLFQGGVKFVLPEGATEQQEYINKVWDLNKKEITLYQVGLYGAVHGTWYAMLNPDDVIDPYTGKTYPRIVPLNPRIVRIKTEPQDMNRVLEYKIEYAYKGERNGREVEILHREIIHRAAPAGEDVSETWIIDRYEQVGSAPIVLLDSILWPYDFPPIIHCKNLPSLEGCYGDSEIDDIVNIQDKNNFAVSNVGKIIKFHAHPQTVGTGFSTKEITSLDTAVGVMRTVPNADAKVYNLEMQSDMTSSREYYKDLQKSMFDIAREVDVTSLNDRQGQLTNFGVRVLYTDAVQKNDTKRQLYGDTLLEINRRLLVLANFVAEATVPGTVAWGDPLPVDIREEMEADKRALDMKIVDHETVAKRYESRYGVDWETIKKRLDDESAEARRNNPLLNGDRTPESEGTRERLPDMPMQRQMRDIAESVR